MGNAGFVGLANPLGVLFVIFSLFLFSAIIYVGAKLVRVKETSDKEYRARLKQQVDARKNKV